MGEQIEEQALQISGAIPVPAGARQRIEANLEAIRVTRSMRDSDTDLTPVQREVLTRWTSWGAIPQIFDEADPRFAAEREQRRELLDAEEWKAARRTTLNAHYTDSEYTRPMWDALGQLGFTGGQVLKPGCNGGAFLASAPSPDHLPDGLRLTDVELDPMTAQIEAALDPHTQVHTESFANSPFRKVDESPRVC